MPQRSNHKGRASARPTGEITQIIVSPKFPLGQVVATANADSQLHPLDVAEALQRHASGDWGDLCSEDTAQNDLALIKGSRLFSSYRSPQRPDGTRFWIITEWDRSVTTVLLPMEY
jgi:hypothetical protein